MKIIERYITRELLIPFSVVAAILVGLVFGFQQRDAFSGGRDRITRDSSDGEAHTVEDPDRARSPAADIFICGGCHGARPPYKDQEISVLRSAGVSEHRITYAVLLVAIPIGIASGVISVFLRPWAYTESYIMNAQAEAELNTDRFQAGRFYGSERKGRVVYIRVKG